MKDNQKYGVLSLLFRICADYFKTAKIWGLVEQGVAVLRALSWTAGAIATQELFESISNTHAGEERFWYIAVRLGILSLVVVGQQILSGGGKYLLSKISYTNMGKLMAEFQRKLGRVPAKNFENVDFLNDVKKAKDCLEYEVYGHFSSVCIQIVTYYLVFFLSIGGYLFWLSPTLPLVILAAFFPSVLGQLAQVKVFAAMEEKNAPLRRKYEYCKKAIASREFLKETRILGGFRFFHKLFYETLLNITKKTWETERNAAIIVIFLNIASFIGLGASVLILFSVTMKGDISIGAFAAVFTSLSQIFSIMDEIVSSHLSGAREALGKVANYYRLMDMSEAGGEQGTPDYSCGVVAKGVSFTYPGSKTAAVRDITLTIKAGETIAIVGENGSGKSTLVRLLIGLYSPDTGSVEIGGHNTVTTHPSAIFKGISGVFQNYQRYKMTLEENVSISDTAIPPDIKKIRAALRASEFNENIAALDTLLSPEFDGIDLSGGQWQRLAIARGLYRVNNFIILDEPTAAIDPIEEARLYNLFSRLTEGKCAVIVTHRLGSVKLADRILVMKNGEIDDIGSHDELLVRKGEYADMWKSQASWYTHSPLDL